eukprot:3453574-Rhodomonas_salina.1
MSLRRSRMPAGKTMSISAAHLPPHSVNLRLQGPGLAVRVLHSLLPPETPNQIICGVREAGPVNQFTLSSSASWAALRRASLTCSSCVTAASRSAMALSSPDCASRTSSCSFSTSFVMNLSCSRSCSISSFSPDSFSLPSFAGVVCAASNAFSRSAILCCSSLLSSWASPFTCGACGTPRGLPAPTIAAHASVFVRPELRTAPSSATTCKYQASLQSSQSLCASI